MRCCVLHPCCGLHSKGGCRLRRRLSSDGAGGAAAASRAVTVPPRAQSLLPNASTTAADPQWHLFDEGGGCVPSLEPAAAALPAAVPGEAPRRCLARHIRTVAWPLALVVVVAPCVALMCRAPLLWFSDRPV